MELIMVNPLARAGGGLRELLGNALFDALQGLGSGVAGLSISHLTEWMAHAPPPHATPPAPPAPAAGRKGKGAAPTTARPKRKGAV